jgi:hypothetical protein
LFKSKPTTSPSPASDFTPAPGGGNGKVWVNTETHVYHSEKSRYYGKTKKGKYMTEAKGDRPAKRGE